MRSPATSGGTRHHGRRAGRAADRGGLRHLPGVLDGAVADDRLVDLEAAVDDVEQDRLARDEVERVRQERVVLGDDVDLARRRGSAGHDRRGRRRRPGITGRDGQRSPGANAMAMAAGARRADPRRRSDGGEHGAKSMTRRPERRPDGLDTLRRGAAQCGAARDRSRPRSPRTARRDRHRGPIWRSRPRPPTPASADPTPSGVAVAPRDGSSKRYGDVVAVDGIDLDVRDGEFFSMLGPSGSGKTTTLRMIAGFELPTAGRILLHGADVTTPRRSTAT